MSDSDSRGTVQGVRVGDVIRSLREGQGLSLRTLASRAGFTASFISQVENGQASPSIASLEKLAGALGVGLGEFFAAAGRPEATITKAGERPGMDSQWSHAVIEALAPSFRGRALDAVMITLNPNGSSGRRPFAQPVEQLAVVFEGRVVLTLDSEPHHLQRGDSVSVRPDCPHRWENRSSRPAQILIVSSRRSR